MTEHIETDKLPTDALEQDVPVGGVVDGKMPAVAVQTIAAGITTTRDVPPLRLNAFSTTQTQNAAGVEPFRIGRETRRRRIHLSVAPDASTTAYIVIAATREQAMNGDGYPLPPNGRITIEAADMMWISAVGANLRFGFLVELDQG